jgi:hypothetical protein
MNGPSTVAPHHHEPHGGASDAALERVLTTLRHYRGQIFLLLVAIGVLYAIGALLMILGLPSRRASSIPFRLVFDGAKSGIYPNGTKFEPSEIVSVPVLSEVYNANNLKEYTSFGNFSRAFFVSQSNQELERLSADYRARLSDLRLTPVDRERIEREFDDKRAAIENSEFAIHFTRRAATKEMPNPLVEKVLRDTLSAWAGYSTKTKRVLDSQVRILSENAIETVVPPSEPAVALLILRHRADALLTNMEPLATIPGASLVRVGRERKSLPEVRLDLQDVIRFQLDPLIHSLPASGGIRNRAGLLGVLNAQLEYDQRLLAAARAKETAIRQVLETYDRTGNDSSASASAAPQQNGGGEIVSPQLTPGFIDRMLELANRDKDLFRQRLAQDLRVASMEKLPAEALVTYDEGLLRTVGGGPFAPYDPQATASLLEQWRAAAGELRRIAGDVRGIYAAASAQLHPATELFTVSGPMITATQRSVAYSRVFLYGVLVLLLSLPLIVAGCMLHERLRQRRVEDDVVMDDEPDIAPRAARVPQA